jgi:hypothetical protein
MCTWTSSLIALLLLALLGLFGWQQVSFAQLDSAPKPWDEAYLLTLPTKLVETANDEGLGAAVRDYYTARIFKPPLSQIGTSISMAAFGTEPTAAALDNLVVALLIAVLVALFVRRSTGTWIGSALGICFLASPAILLFARTELAELYVVLCTLLFYRVLLLGNPFGTWRASLGAGALGGLGVCAKLSFPLIAAPIALWALSAELLRIRREGGARPLLRNVAVALSACVLVVAALCGKNWKHMWRHLREQYGWVGEQFGGAVDRWSGSFLQQYVYEWGRFVGWIWLGAAALLLAGLLARKMAGAPEPDLNSGDGVSGTSAADRAESEVQQPSLLFVSTGLVFALLLNLAYCYFFPVVDPRFSIGAIVAFVLLMGIGLARLHRWMPMVSRIGLILFVALQLVFVASNAHVTRAADPTLLALDLPILGRLEEVLPAPATDPDLREVALREAGLRDAGLEGGKMRIGLAGDHPHFNVDNLRLWALREDAPLEFVQVAYFGPEQMPMAARIEAGGRVDAWLICLAPEGSTPSLWSRRLGEPALRQIEQQGQYERVSWTAELNDGSRLLVLRRR